MKLGGDCVLPEVFQSFVVGVFSRQIRARWGGVIIVIQRINSTN